MPRVMTLGWIPDLAIARVSGSMNRLNRALPSGLSMTRILLRNRAPPQPNLKEFRAARAILGLARNVLYSGMALKTQQTLNQRLIMAPNLTIALRILRMTNLELQTFLRQQVQENPILDVEENTKDPQTESSDSQQVDSNSDWDDWPAFGQADGGNGGGSAAGDQHRNRIENSSRPASLYDHLGVQLRCLPLSQDEIHGAELLIENLNPDGYLDTSLEEIAQHTHYSLAQLEALLETLQSLDPPGIGARNLKECLELQLEQRGRRESLAFQVLESCFEEFTHHRLDRIARGLHCSKHQAEKAVNEIISLNPKPGQSFSEDISQSLVPDLVMHKREEYYDVELADPFIPQVMINRMYYRMMRHTDTPPEVKQFLHDKFRKASWVIRAIDERNATLLAIARCLLSLQTNFIENGPSQMKPLTQAQVAKLIGRHPSTVSRAIAGKTIDTPFGILPLERFFATGIKQSAGGDSKSVSDEQIKAEIERLISEEDPAHPLSDEALVDCLRKQQLSVARRTVAKYRSALKILPTHLRRKRH